MSRLLTAIQVCETFGLPKSATLRWMRAKGLPFVMLGKSCLYDAADVSQFIEAQKTCHARTPAPASIGTMRAEPSISDGMNAEKSASVARAQATAEKLKNLSRNSSAQVINLPINPARAIPKR